ncbi:MAG: 16S rRNA processing protein RimM [Bacilli bacterium]|nr:16S rRNA processing protein RimM [Bacilli bacterium]
MDKVFIGKIVSTHGIKGEVRILSDFMYKEKVFFPGNKLVIDDKEYSISSYRVHKNYDMVTFDGFNNINEVLFMMKKNVYVYKDSIKLDDDEILDEELLTYKVLCNDKEGIIKEIFMASKDNKILRVLFDKEVLIPFKSPMIKKIDKNNKCVIVELIDGME